LLFIRHELTGRSHVYPDNSPAMMTMKTGRGGEGRGITGISGLASTALAPIVIGALQLSPALAAAPASDVLPANVREALTRAMDSQEEEPLELALKSLAEAEGLDELVFDEAARTVRCTYPLL
jgi:hypothetical protein